MTIQEFDEQEIINELEELNVRLEVASQNELIDERELFDISAGIGNRIIELSQIMKGRAEYDYINSVHDFNIDDYR